MSSVDLPNRLRALQDHDATLLIEAGAGTGKTAILAGRLALLLARGADPSGVVAITFTELAASDLSARIRTYVDGLLKGEVPLPLRAALPQGLSEIQQERLKAAKRTLDELTCTTIHGFCQQLVTPYPVQAGIDPGASVMDEGATELNFSLQFSDWLRTRLSIDGKDDPIADVLLHENKDTLIRELASALYQRRDASTPATDLSQADFDALQYSIRKFLDWYAKVGFDEPKASSFSDCFEQLALHYKGGFTASMSFAGLWAYANLPDLEICKQDLSFRAAPSKKGWQEATCACGKSKALGDLLAGECKIHIAEVEAEFANLRGKVAELVMARLIEAIVEFRTEFQEFKRKSALLDFDDLLVQARDLLRNSLEVRKALSQRYRYILVDEFQDTDPIQCEILFLLCGEDRMGEWFDRPLRPGQLFLVGDPKQSIYRFRRADVDMYCRVRDIIARQFPANVLQITANFRSTAPVLDHVNKVFAAPLAQLGFADLECTVKESAPSCAAVACVDVGGAEDPRADSRRELEAREIADVCHKLIGNLEVRDPESGKLCRCKAGHIALLSPTSTGLWMYERAFEQLGIPIASQAGKGLFRRQEIHDLIAIARVLSSGRDTMAFGALLRGPLVGLTEEELLDIASDLPEGKRLNVYTDPDLIRHPVAAATLRTLIGLRKKAYGTTPFDILSKAIDELRVRPLLIARHPRYQERALANVDVFLEMSRPFSVIGMRGFAQEMMRRWQDAEQEVEGRCDAVDESVQIVTIHSAKGLEWPVVIPINMCSTQRAIQGVLYSSHDATIHCKSGNIVPPSYGAVKQAEETQRRMENVRLWYVAATRARDLLLLPRHAASPKGSTWFDLVDHRLKDLPGFVAPNATAGIIPAELANRQTAEIFEAEAKRVAERTTTVEWHQPSRHEKDDAWPDEEPREEALVLTAPLVLGSSVRGTVIHKLIEEVLSSQSSDSLEALVERAAQLIPQLGAEDHSDATQGPSSAEIARAVHSTLNLPEVARWRTQLMPEFNIYSAVSDAEGQLRCTAGICDAVACADGKPQVIFDWKSDVNPTVDTQRRHIAQLKDYLETTDCPQGFLVYVTRQTVREVTSEVKRAEINVS